MLSVETPCTSTRCTWSAPGRAASTSKMCITAAVRLCEAGRGLARTAVREFSALPDGLRAMWLPPLGGDAVDARIRGRPGATACGSGALGSRPRL